MRTLILGLGLAAIVATGCRKTGDDEYQVTTPDIDVSTDTSTLRTPDVDVVRDSVTVPVPKVRVDTNP